MGAQLRFAELELLTSARAAGRSVLLETEGRALLAALGVGTPRSVFVRDAAEARRAPIERLGGSRLVVKVVSAEILHKSDVGGVRIVPAEVAAVTDAITAMQQSFHGREVAGYTIDAFVEHDTALGGELLVGMRWTEDFGPVVTLSPGGVYAEALASALRPGREMSVFSPSDAGRRQIGEVLERQAITPIITGTLRGQKARISTAELTGLIERFLDFAAATMPEHVSELEVNPLVLTADGPVALDVLVKLGDGPRQSEPERPRDKLARLLEPRSAAVIGVSEGLNPGHVILNNLIREGFDRERIYVVKPGKDSIEGCRCYPDVQSLPERTDLFIVGVAAPQVPELIEEVVAHEKAESLILIPGGLGERSGTEELAARITDALARSRSTAWRGPVVNGGNCLGIRSKPGRYDTLFIPGHKLPPPDAPVAPLAIISQSGAFAISNLSKLGALNPRFLISVGNQTDLTVGDYLEHLADDPEIRVFACYVEGFRPGDGLRWLEAARKITASGRTVLLYRAGRTRAGAQATASHTASIAGDYAVTRELATTAGVVVVESLADFEDLTRLVCLLDGKAVRGLRLAGISNAGFECVGIADNADAFSLPPLGEATAARLEEIFRKCRIDEVVDVHNPVDLTPLLDDASYEEVIRACLDDDGVDAAVVGCVPLAPAIQSLPRADDHPEDAFAEGAVVNRMARLKDELAKPFVACLDGGAIYDPMARRLEELGVPTFRTIDRALHLFTIFCRERLRAQMRQTERAAPAAAKVAR